MTRDVELNTGPTDVTTGLTDGKSYLVQNVGRADASHTEVWYLESANANFPHPPPKRPHVLAPGKFAGIKVETGKGIFFWVPGAGGLGAVAISEAG